ncbi:MAG TPA: response regulator transcription factor [Candidatus Dormibacteraeota bacterium]|nr:response regulator transcription factor [Candidatus Dormibacteraeota bacterium]
MATSFSERLSGPGPDRRLTVLLVGAWSAMPADTDSLTLEMAEFRRAPGDLRAFKRMAGHYDPSWLLVGLGVDEWDTRAFVRSARAVLPMLHLGMLGSLDEPDRYERWLRQNCRVYVTSECTPRRMVMMLRTSMQHGVVLVDKVFQEGARARVEEPVTSLTRREQEVLQLVGRGLRNIDVARALHVAERTVEFHMSRLLVKLGARNRVEAVERATSLGLL